MYIWMSNRKFLVCQIVCPNYVYISVYLLTYSSCSIITTLYVSLLADSFPICWRFFELFARSFRWKSVDRMTVVSMSVVLLPPHAWKTNLRASLLMCITSTSRLAPTGYTGSDPLFYTLSVSTYRQETRFKQLLPFSTLWTPCETRRIFPASAPSTLQMLHLSEQIKLKRMIRQT